MRESIGRSGNPSVSFIKRSRLIDRKLIATVFRVDYYTSRSFSDLQKTISLKQPSQANQMKTIDPKNCGRNQASEFESVPKTNTVRTEALLDSRSKNGSFLQRNKI